jgi:uncharacterized protein YceK
MKRKSLFLIVFIILAVFLSGCNGVITPATDEAKIKSVIYEYFLALNDQNWSKAKSYCVYGSDQYYAVCQAEDLFNTAYLLCNQVTINFVVNIIDVSISGSYSQVHSYVSYLVTYCGYYEADEGDSYLELQKVGNSWKLY